MSTQTKKKIWHVLVIDDDAGRRSLDLSGITCTIGRDPSNAIVLNSSGVSRQHAILLRVPTANGQFFYRIFDGNAEGKRSTNGILVNGQRCASHDLRDGDHISFGSNVEAQYYIREMTDQDFSRYLEAVAYRSVKSETVDPRTTTMQRMDAPLSPITSAVSPEDPTQSEGSRPRRAWWQPLLQTLWKILKTPIFTPQAKATKAPPKKPSATAKSLRPKASSKPNSSRRSSGRPPGSRR
ncbi:MAG: FHA domain-containing protein [Cyanobacteriota bacterium]|nr:FHA domain-containing protein [Cyanobacteriota bacterium]